jgi:hypothetical protein
MPCGCTPGAGQRVADRRALGERQASSIRSTVTSVAGLARTLLA